MSTTAEHLVVINECVNTDLSEAIRKLLQEHKCSITAAQATLAFVLGDCIGETCHAQGIPQDRMCSLASCYEAYLHNVAHAVYDGVESGELRPRGAKKHH